MLMNLLVSLLLRSSEINKICIGIPQSFNFSFEHMAGDFIKLKKILRASLNFLGMTNLSITKNITVASTSKH